MNRHLKAFLIAPLVVPGLITPFILPALRTAPWMFGLGLMTAAIASYAGALLVGAPAYLALRSRGWTAFWIAPVVGFVVGVITGIVAIPIVVGLTLPGSAPGGGLIRAIALAMEGFPSLAQLGLGIWGALVGVVLWLIGRPDRP